jgi:hypothetical protein
VVAGHGLLASRPDHDGVVDGLDGGVAGFRTAHDRVIGRARHAFALVIPAAAVIRAATSVSVVTRPVAAVRIAAA